MSTWLRALTAALVLLAAAAAPAAAQRTPLTAEDVKAVYERNLAPGKTVVTAGFGTIDKIEATGPGTLRITTKKPDPLMPVRMAQMGGYIYPKRFATDDGVKELARKPIGTGA